MKLSEYPELSGKGYGWYYFNANIDVTFEAASLGELLIYDPSDEEYHLEKLDYDR